MHLLGLLGPLILHPQVILEPHLFLVSPGDPEVLLVLFLLQDPQVLEDHLIPQVLVVQLDLSVQSLQYFQLVLALLPLHCLLSVLHLQVVLHLLKVQEVL